jgi:hypothetical protein
MSFSVVSIPEERIFEGNVFPLTLSWQGESPSDNGIASLVSWIHSNKSTIDQYLFDHCAVLLRCSSVCKSHDDFHAVIEATGYAAMDYLGGAAVRTQLTSRVFTANESPSSEPIPFHHEMAQTPMPPTHLFFFCEVAPSTGGETPILISTEVCGALEQLHPEFMKNLEERGVNYIRNIPEFDDPTSAIGRGWRSTFLTETRGID